MIPAAPEVGGDIEMEGHMTAIVAADKTTVDPDIAAIVDCAEMQQQCVKFPVGEDLEVAAVPDDFVDIPFIDTGFRALIRKRHQNLSAEEGLVLPLFGPAHIRIIVSEVPP